MIHRADVDHALLDRRRRYDWPVGLELPEQIAGAGIQAVDKAIDRAKVEAQRHRAEEVTLVFYFSGHGDRDALHLAGDRVLVSELSAKLAEVPAGLRIAVTDACRQWRWNACTATV